MSRRLLILPVVLLLVACSPAPPEDTSAPTTTAPTSTPSAYPTDPVGLVAEGRWVETLEGLADPERAERCYDDGWDTRPCGRWLAQQVSGMRSVTEIANDSPSLWPSMLERDAAMGEAYDEYVETGCHEQEESGCAGLRTEVLTAPAELMVSYEVDLATQGR